ncbi:MAG: 3'-5' exonuclease [Shewanella sp.]
MKAFIDLETGGFSISKNGVCEIAMVITDNRLNILHEFHTLIKPYTRESYAELVSYKPDAMAVNRISIEDLHSKGRDVCHVTQEIIELIHNWKIVTIIGHNSIAFDVPRLDYLLNRFQNCTIKKMFHLDTLPMAKNRYNFDSYSLEHLCTQFGIVNEKTHSALGDAKATIELYRKLSAID